MVGGSSGFAVDAEGVVAVAERTCELDARGFDSLFLPEHTHIPVGRKTPAPMGEPLPDYYHHLLDPFVALTAAASASGQLRVGTGICLVAQRDPFVPEPGSQGQDSRLPGDTGTILPASRPPTRPVCADRTAGSTPNSSAAIPPRSKAQTSTRASTLNSSARGKLAVKGLSARNPP